MPTNATHLMLPDALRKRIRDFERTLCRTEFIFASSVAFAVLIGAHLVLFLSDRMWDTAIWLRAILAASTVATIVLGAAFWARYWLIKRRNLGALASLIQRHHRQLGDRLQGIVELADHSTPGESEALRRAAIHQVAQDALKLDFRAAVPTAATRRAARISLTLALVTTIGCALAPHAFLNASARLRSPLQAIPRYTFTSLRPLPPQMIVAHGATFALPIAINEDSAYVPTFVHANAVGFPRVTAVVQDHRATLQMPGAMREVVVEVAAGDDAEAVRIIPMHPPVATEVEATVDLPAYLQRTAYTERVRSGGLRVVNGSTVALTARANRRVQAADLDGVPLVRSGDQMTMPAMLVSGPKELALSFSDTHGLTPAAPLLIHIQAVADEPPALALRFGDATAAVLPDEVLRYAFACTDDYGVDEVSLHYARESEEGDLLPAAAMEMVYGSPTDTLVRAEFAVSPLALGIQPGETVHLHAEAYDFLPGREPVHSESVRIRVLSLEEHAELVRRAVDDMQADLEQLVRAQDSENSATEDLLERSPSERNADATTRALEQGAERQERNADTLREMAREAGELARQAMKNEEFSEDTVAQLAELAAAMQSTSQGAMQKAAQALQQSSQAEDNERKTGMEDAVAQQEQAMDELRAMQEQLNEGVESMMAESFVNRLRQAAKAERDVSQGLQQDLSSTAGIRASDLPPGPQRERQEQRQTHEQNRDEVAYIRDDLAGFFNRTGRGIYSEIYSNMTAEAVVEGLGDVTRLLTENRAFLAIDGAETWAARLDEWAALLAEDSKKQQSQSPSSGPTQEMTQEELAILLQLERARQREEAIRARTRRLDQVVDESPTYATDARALSREQSELARAVIGLERIVMNEQVARLVEVIGGEMLNVRVKLREPRTDQTTIAIQTEIIELLSSSMEQVMQQSAASAALSQMMTMMGIMPGSGTGGTGPSGPGGMLKGGPGDTPDTVEKSGGVSGGLVPEEFQDALRGYLQQIEDLRP